MRLWSLHPKHLDVKGLVAVWREGLLAQKVLQGLTQGYRHHPQLLRFRELSDPVAGLATYLDAVYQEAKQRNYRFFADKIAVFRTSQSISVTEGQLSYEWQHFKAKLAVRDPSHLAQLPEFPEVHPLFKIVPGPVADWEIVIPK